MDIRAPCSLMGNETGDKARDGGRNWVEEERSELEEWLRGPRCQPGAGRQGPNSACTVWWK